MDFGFRDLLAYPNDTNILVNFWGMTHLSGVNSGAANFVGCGDSEEKKVD